MGSFPETYNELIPPLKGSVKLVRIINIQTTVKNIKAKHMGRCIITDLEKVNQSIVNVSPFGQKETASRTQLVEEEQFMILLKEN